MAGAPPSLPRASRGFTAYLAPALAAVIAWGIFSFAAAEESLAMRRGLVFASGPLILLAGLHARLFGFLHAPERMRLLPLPLPARAHWRSATREHGPGLLWSGVLGCAAVGLSGGDSAGALAVEFAGFVVMAALVEPAIAGAAALLGRRFEDGSSLADLQRSAGGGWTTPEAVVHLYAPALGLGLAALLALPGQLTWERWVDGKALEAQHVTLSLVPVAIGVGLRLAAGWAYAQGLWEAAPRLAEATVTLAGPPTPEHEPAWLRILGPRMSPWSRLMATQFWRLAPLPGLRLGAVLGLAVVFALRGDPPGVVGVALAAVAVGIWAAPLGPMLRQRHARARLAGSLPLPAGPRQGRGRSAALLFAAPAVILTLVVALRAVLAGSV